MKINIVLVLFTVMSVLDCQAQEPTVWRNGTDGVYPASNLMDQWPEEGPEIIWSSEVLGNGHSSPVVTDGAVYVTGLEDGTGYLFKFDLDGNLVYRKAYGPEYAESYNGPRGSPVIVGDRIYLVSGYGHVYCMNEGDARKLWEIDMVSDLGGEIIRWGYNETPVIDGNKIYCTPGGQKHNVVALDRFSGKVIWSCPGKQELSAYCTPLLFSHNGRKILATHTASSLLGIDAESGNLLWSHEHPNQYSVHANTPIYQDGGLFFFSGYGKGSGKLVLSADGSSVHLAWNNPMDSRMGGAVWLNGYIYGSGDRNREWRCIDWETGKDMYTSTELGKGVVIAADGKLFCYSERGELALVNATPEEFDLVSETRVRLGSEQHWSHPVIRNGILYLRHGKALIAFELKN